MMKKILAFMVAFSFMASIAYAAEDCKNRGTLD